MTSETGEYAKGSRGFTLVELLVALAIIGLVTGVVIVNLPQDDRAVRRVAERLAAKLNHARQESILEAAPYGVAIAADGARFFTYRERSWQLATEQSALAPLDWERGIEVTSRKLGQRSTVSGSKNSKVFVPDLVFQPVGLAEALEVRVVRNEVAYVVDVDHGGQIHVAREINARN